MWAFQQLMVKTMGASVALGIFMLSCLVGTGLSINCYQCNSTSLDCLEKFMYPNPLQPESCGDMFEARYCIKTTGIYEGVVGTRRFCSKDDLGNLCHFIPHEGDNREYKGCVYTCNSDGCNGANLQMPMSVFLTVAASLSALLFATFQRWSPL